ncbi:MAG: DUF5688 family protein [Lachnospiraceae bacterium]|nr:DUF5688 family protein [Lachnospiraceae bacterium]
MEFNEFCEKVKRHVEEHYGASKTVTMKNVMKNNGFTLTGLVVSGDESNISPTVYLNGFYEAYEDGETMTSVVQKVIEVADTGQLSLSINIESFTDFEKAKGNIVYKLIGNRSNTELLSKIPHVSMLDMEIVFFFLIEGTVEGNASVLITNEHMKRWGTDTETLMGLAKSNTPRLMPSCVHRMEDLIRQMFIENVREKYEADHVIPGIEDGEDPEHAMNRLADEVLGAVTDSDRCIPMLVVSNSLKYFGAACMLYENVLSELAKRIGGGFYLLPSSVHEFIAVDERYVNAPEELAEMVKEVNATQVRPDEVLTDSVYHFDRKNNKLTLAVSKKTACANM